MLHVLLLRTRRSQIPDLKHDKGLPSSTERSFGVGTARETNCSIIHPTPYKLSFRNVGSAPISLRRFPIAPSRLDVEDKIV